MNALGMEAEELGMVALIGLVLVPGFMWVANGKSAGAKIVRAAVVGSLIIGTVALEASLDKSANSASGLLEGDAK